MSWKLRGWKFEKARKRLTSIKMGCDLQIIINIVKYRTKNASWFIKLENEAQISSWPMFVVLFSGVLRSLTTMSSLYAPQKGCRRGLWSVACGLWGLWSFLLGFLGNYCRLKRENNLKNRVFPVPAG
jgi:hypothetical protein